MNTLDYVTESKQQININKCYNFLRDQPWCKELTLVDFRKSIEHSFCISTVKQTIQPNNFNHYEQSGFLRIITDYVQFAYITDVIVFPEYQGQGISKKMLNYVFNRSVIKDVKEHFLITDVGGVYEQFGFKPFRYQEMFWSRSPKNDGEYSISSKDYYRDQQ